MMRRRARRRSISAPRGLARAWASDSEGAAVVVVAVALVVLIGFAALVIDLGHLIVVRSELQNAADAGALAGVVDLVNTGPTAAEAMAVTYTTQWDNYRLTSPTPAADAVDVTALDAETLRVRVWKDVGTSAGAVPTTFARIWGIQTAGVEAVAVASLNRKIIGTGPGNLMPFGINENFVDANGDGDYDVGTVVDIYPHDYSPGNFGLLDLNGGSNSNAETKDWIENGYNDNFVIPEDAGYLNVEGDPGISGGSLDPAISSRIDDLVVFPVFDQVSGQGANTIFRVVDLMGGKIKSFRLTGSQSQRNIMVEITNFTTSSLIVGSASVSDNNSLGVPILIQ